MLIAWGSPVLLRNTSLTEEALAEASWIVCIHCRSTTTAASPRRATSTPSTFIKSGLKHDRSNPQNEMQEVHYTPRCAVAPIPSQTGRVQLHVQYIMSNAVRIIR